MSNVLWQVYEKGHCLGLRLGTCSLLSYAVATNDSEVDTISIGCATNACAFEG